MLKTVITGLVASALVSVINSASVSAASQDIPVSHSNNDVAIRLVAIADDVPDEDAINLENLEASDQSQKDKSKVHIVKENENLTEIAEKYDTTWQRMFYKNDVIITPDHIEPGVKLKIPKADEKLESREIPIPPAPQPMNPHATTTPSRSVSAQQTQKKSTTRPTNTAGNGYVYGYCTWHVKNLRPDLPNSLGNANTWVARASALGFSTGSTPRVGAVAQATTGYMHVAYVTAVHKDGTITVSEMNYRGWGTVNSRTTSASAFTYIY
jgi:surface antigen